MFRVMLNIYDDRYTDNHTFSDVPYMFRVMVKIYDDRYTDNHTFSDKHSLK